ncbi:MAG: hypothetical protein ACREVE_05485 [Gammaproteobacteria bacterium]
MKLTGIAIVAACFYAPLIGAQTYKRATIEDYPEPAQVTVTGNNEVISKMPQPAEKPGYRFREDMEFTVEERNALDRLHNAMDSGWQPYVFCCGSPGDADAIKPENRVALAGAIFNKYKLMPGQIIDAHTFQQVAMENVRLLNGAGESANTTFLDGLKR